MKDIRRQHWLALGMRHGVLAEDGREVHFVVDDLVDRTPRVVTAVRKQLPRRFPRELADSVLQGLEGAADRLAG